MLRILSFCQPELDEQIAKFNKKAKKWKLPEVTYQVTKEWVQKRENHFMIDGEECVYEYKVEVMEIEITGEIPRIAGWSIHSKIQPSEVKGQNYVFTTQGHDPVESLRTCPMFCDHCQTKRLKLTAYRIENAEEGKSMMVGATCLKDFLPNINIESLLGYLDRIKAIGEFDEDYDCIPRSAFVYNLRNAIMDAYCSITKYGFLSKAKAQESEGEPTAYHIDPSQKRKDDMYKEWDFKAAEQILEGFIPHIMAKSEADNDFIYNVKLALASEYIRPKLYGYLAAAVNVWMKDNEEVKRAAANPGLNEYVGDIGQRVQLHSVKIVRCNAREGDYGTTYIYGMVDAKGRDLTWFASKKFSEVDAVVNLKGTVKNHNEFKGRKQTILTRCATC